MARAADKRVVAPVVALIVAVLATVFGKRVDGVPIAQVGGYLTAVLSTVLAAIHGPKVVRHIKHHHHTEPEFTIVFDMVTPGAVRLASTSPDAVVGYANGRYENVEAIERDYPNHRHYFVAVNAFDRIKANFLDVENGDARPDQIPDWIMMQLALRGLKRKDLKLIVKWDAQWDHIPRIPTGFQGKQYLSAARFDESIFLTMALDGDPIGVYASASVWPAIFARLDAAGLRL